MVFALVYAATAAPALCPQTTDASTADAISARRIMAHTRHLASDQLEGRAPGTRGETLTVRYLEEQLHNIGIEPGNPNGAWTQVVPMVGYTVTNAPDLLIANTAAGAGDGERKVRLRYGQESVSWSLRRSPTTEVEGAELVFVGHGVVAPEYGWNDFKEVDVSGKIVLMLVGDPPHPDQSLFAGPAMTYYGRWNYKFDIAAEKGAAAAIIVHTEADAGYPWAVVKNSWGGEQFEVARARHGTSRCAVESWVSSAAAEKIFAAAGLTLTEARRQAASKDFEPRILELAGSVRIDATIREVHSHNIVGLLPGLDANKKNEHVIYTAHWDHLGRGSPVDGDSIYNGALDNASGVAGLLEIAGAFAANREDLARSVLFIFTTAEESGLLGARYYIEHPIFPLEGAVAAINVDGLNVWGRTSDVVVIGYGRSELDDYLAEVVATQDRYLRPDGAPEKGYYYRSDHFAFAKKGIPVLYAESGVRFRGRRDGWGAEMRGQYLEQCYHKPQDEVETWWDLSGAAEDMEMLLRVGLKIATSDVYPQMKAASEFKREGDGRSQR